MTAASTAESATSLADASGCARPLYTAAMPAVFRWNAQIGALYQRLIAAGKVHKLAATASLPGVLATV
jgi:hypothetical protein